MSFSANVRIRRDYNDKLFSEYIRRRDGWVCVVCGKPANLRDIARGRGKTSGIDCSHFYGRRNYAVRFDTDNADAMCRNCHRELSENPADYAHFKWQQLGEHRYNKLRARAHTRGKKYDFEMTKIYLRKLLGE